MSHSLVYVTVPEGSEARRIGRLLVERRLAPSANVLPGLSSIYRWKGRIEEAAEAVLVLKVRTDLVERIVEAIREEHPYDCPGIVAMAITAGNPDYLAWIDADTADAREAGTD